MGIIEKAITAITRATAADVQKALNQIGAQDVSIETDALLPERGRDESIEDYRRRRRLAKDFLRERDARGANSYPSHLLGTYWDGRNAAKREKRR